MSPQEYFPPSDEDNDPIDPFFGQLEQIEEEQPEPTGAELELAKRRELVVHTTEAIEEIIDAKVDIKELMTLAKSKEASFERLRARRALRCIQDIGEEDSEVLALVGEGGVYHYAESVILYGANKEVYLELMEECGLSAEDATGLYALREIIMEETQKDISFVNVLKALQKAGLTIEVAVADAEGAMEVFEDAGFFVNYNNGHIYDHPTLKPNWPASKAKLGKHIDNFRSDIVTEHVGWIRDYVEGIDITDIIEEKTGE